MTALAGLWSFSGEEVETQLGRMLRAQEMYGKQSRQRRQGPIALGRHLHCCLPEDVHDLGPQDGGDGSMLLVADLRLDNRSELASALAITSDRLRRMPDAAVLMAALERWGEDAVPRLLGDFAFAWWDGPAERIILARDFLGQRPLHFHRGKDFFAFASMPKGLHALPRVPYALNKDAVADFVALIPETDSETFFEGIAKVIPGHVVQVTRERVSSRRYWDPAPSLLMLKDNREYEEAVRAELDRAVACRLRGSGDRIGAHLSGGLDSSAICATAARQASEQSRILAYTAVPRPGYVSGVRDSFADEGPLAAMVASLYPNIEHVMVAASGSSPLDQLDRYFHIFERPLLNLCNGVWMTAILDHAQKNGVTVLLSGGLGNMSFSYDGVAGLAEMARKGHWGQLARSATSLARNGMRLGTLGSALLGPFLPQGVWSAIGRLRGAPSALTDYTAIHPDRVDELTQRASANGLDVGYRPRSDPHALRKWAIGRVDMGNYNKGYLGGWGVDTRDPAADQRLVELCLAIPNEQYLAGGVPRSLARRAFADRLPAAVCSERRKGYQAADWHEALTAARSQLAEEIDRAAAVPVTGELLDLAAMQSLVANWPTGQWNEKSKLHRYRLALLRGTSAAHFIRKASRGNN